MKKKPYYPSKKKEGANNGKNRVANYSSDRGNRQKEFAKVNGGVFVYSKPISVADLSKAINVPVPAIIKYLFLQGTFLIVQRMAYARC